MQLWLLQAEAKPVPDSAFATQVGHWFRAWELVSRDVYGIRQLYPVDFIFFDEQYVYTTSAVTVPAGKIIQGPRLMNHSYTWKKSAYTDSIRLPDGKQIEAGILSFAGTAETVKGLQKAFFVMPLPSFWAKAGMHSQELGLEKLVTGIFLHEFSHSQQVNGFGKQVTALEKTHWPGTELTDDIIQQLFEKDSVYKQRYEQENAFLYALAEKPSADNRLLKEALQAYRGRQQIFFSPNAEGLAATEDLFLTMEGLGQFSMYAWLTHPKGGAIPDATAIAGVRRGKKWWSQDEGLALFLVLSRLRSPAEWGGLFFGPKPVTVIQLLEEWQGRNRL